MCAYYIIYYISFFVYNEGSSKSCQSSLSIKGFFRKPTSPPLPLREGPPLISVFFNSLYDPFGSPCRGQKRRSEPFHSMVGGPSEVYASSGAAVFCAGWDRMDTLFRMFVACSMLKGCLLDACCLLELLFDGTADKMDGALRNLLILSSYSP